MAHRHSLVAATAMMGSGRGAAFSVEAQKANGAAMAALQQVAGRVIWTGPAAPR